ncbi:uncharacterized protein LOC141851335 [Brevipalpus obovatus]|uniref:uncharacterized protein LOC141851335 n=1 Tax=Brevipalpus obovatus TaxID=246614 RepID=UPI003D9F8934
MRNSNKNYLILILISSFHEFVISFQLPLFHGMLKTSSKVSQSDSKYINDEMRILLCKERYERFDETVINLKDLESPFPCKVYCPIYEDKPLALGALLSKSSASYLNFYNAYFPDGVKCDDNMTCAGDKDFTRCIKVIPPTTTSIPLDDPDSTISTISDDFTTTTMTIPTINDTSARDETLTTLLTTVSTEVPITTTTISSTTTESKTEKPSANLISCSKEGFFRNPYDCKMFYRCVSDPVLETFDLYLYYQRCPANLVFDEKAQSCNYPMFSEPCDDVKPESLLMTNLLTIMSPLVDFTVITQKN